MMIHFDNAILALGTMMSSIRFVWPFLIGTLIIKIRNFLALLTVNEEKRIHIFGIEFSLKSFVFDQVRPPISPKYHNSQGRVEKKHFFSPILVENDV